MCGPGGPTDYELLVTAVRSHHGLSPFWRSGVCRQGALRLLPLEALGENDVLVFPTAGGHLPSDGGSPFLHPHSQHSPAQSSL